ncbi:MAG TPA: hypothetical protein VF006_21025 [Longimicrobium sp.]
MPDASRSAAVPKAPLPTDGPATPTTTVTALDFTKLRLLAECAAGITHADANFVFPHGDALDRSTRPAGDDDVLVPVRADGKYPANSLRLQPEWQGGNKAVPLPVPAGFADALFWSDAAVQKFLFPYVASCAGSRAAEVLTSVQAAWNYYPASRVSVYALLHVISPANVDLSLETLIHVVYAPVVSGNEPPKLTMATLSDFLRAYYTPPPVEAGAPTSYTSLVGVSYHRGNGGKPTRVKYVALRALAEHACSLRDGPRYFVLKAGEAGFRRRLEKELPPVDAGDIVIPAFTPSVPADRPRLRAVVCRPPKGKPRNLANQADALFWSSGAIEQFLFPYYASKGGLQGGLSDLQDIAVIWNRNAPEGPHAATSAGLAGPSGGSAALEDDVVFGLIHMPSSEWMPELETERMEGEIVTSISPRRGLGVLHADGPAAKTQVSTVHDFIANVAG